MKRITMRKKRDVDLLKARLDVYSDEWRTAQPDPITKVKMPTNLTPTGKVRKPRLKKNNTATNVQVNNDGDLKPLIDGKLSKRKRSKSDKVSEKMQCTEIVSDNAHLFDPQLNYHFSINCIFFL